MSGENPAREAARHIIDEKQALAQVITARLYDDMPHLQEKYGERGRGKCLEDMHYNLEHLAPAVELEQPSMFSDYIRWLDSLLRARNVDTSEIAQSLRITAAILEDRLTPHQYSAAAPVIAAGLAVIDPAAGAARD